MTDITDMVTVADFAKEISVTPTTVNGWIEKYNEERDNSFDSEGVIVPLATFGNTRVFSRKTLLELAAEKGNSAAVKAAGYVHPDKFAEMERNYFEKVQEVLELEAVVGSLQTHLADMENQRDHFEKDNARLEGEIQLLNGELDAAKSAVLSMS